MMNLPFLPAVKKNWAKLQKSGKTSSGVYTIDPDGSGAFNVFCDQKTAGPVRGGCWTVFQKRLKDSVAFHRSWTDNKNGFGNLWLFFSGTGQDTPSDNNEKQAPWGSYGLQVKHCVCTFQRTFYTNLVCRTIYSKTAIHGEYWIMA